MDSQQLISHVQKQFTQANLEDIAYVMELLRRKVPTADITGNWAVTIALKLVPHSANQHDPVSMLQEWLWDESHGLYKDLDFACQLCDHPHTIYSFPLHNKVNGNQIRCGSHCVLYFMGLANQLTTANYDLLVANKALTKMIALELEKERRAKIIKALEHSNLSYTYKQSMIELHMSDKYKGKLTPKQAAPVINAIGSGVGSLIKISLSTNKLRADALPLKELLECALTEQQIKALSKK